LLFSVWLSLALEHSECQKKNYGSKELSGQDKCGQKYSIVTTDTQSYIEKLCLR
jgi:hypothetical protein